MAFLSGYLALGSASAALLSTEAPVSAFTELAGNGYARQAVSLAPTGPYQFVIVPTVTFGPASAGWLPATTMGLYDVATGGNLLLAWTMPRGTGFTLASGAWKAFQGGSMEMTFPDLPHAPPNASMVFPPGATIARLNTGETVFAGIALQIGGGSLGPM
jgi:hypothetical protein